MILIYYIFILLILSREIIAENDDYKNDDYKDDDDLNESGFRLLISGGYRPKLRSFDKYIVSIRTARPTAYFGDNHYCTGTIVASNLIITAAHCIMDSNTSSNKAITRTRRISIIAGAPNRLFRIADTEKYTVSEILPHPRFIRKGKNDIAKLFLNGHVRTFSDKIKVMPIRMLPPVVGSNCTTIGWGQLFFNGPYAADLVYTNLTILDKSHCKKVYKERFTDGMLCVGDPLDWEKDACRGDSGSPLICKGKLTGVASWGIRCGSPGFPSVFTDVHYYQNWIRGSSSKLALNFMIFLLAIFHVISRYYEF